MMPPRIELSAGNQGPVQKYEQRKAGHHRHRPDE
jgi:hypothetical protein